MAIKQLTVFVPNRKGTIVEVTDILSKNNINMRALSIAETEDFGILRLIVNDVKAAEKMLKEVGYLIKVTDVVGVKIGDAPGKLSTALNVLDENNINMEYLYAFMARTEKHAYVVLRVADNDAAETALETAIETGVLVASVHIREAAQLSERQFEVHASRQFRLGTLQVLRTLICYRGLHAEGAAVVDLVHHKAVLGIDTI